jgi:hypothetical protein
MFGAESKIGQFWVQHPYFRALREHPTSTRNGVSFHLLEWLGMSYWRCMNWRLRS